uniref:Uncharacterized protein n=1 Tax=Arcella intermedia TaxID=1963864 RepID=A0A6B2LWR6_9EUKA
MTIPTNTKIFENYNRFRRLYIKKSIIKGKPFTMFT